jgi:hypothetical protein
LLDEVTKYRIAKVAAACKYSPLGWAQRAWNWGEGDLEGKQLRTWQRELFAEIGELLQNPERRYHPIRVAVASGHGIGKSAAMSMLGNWAMSCHAGARVVVTANTESQLRTKTSPEFAKWFRSSLTSELFEVDTLKIAQTDKAFGGNWRLDFLPWSENAPEAFAGLHNEGRLVMVMMDEGSAIADNIWEVIEGAMTDENTILIWVVFGNPTRNTGRFRECWRKHRSSWHIKKQIDSRTVEGTNKQALAEWATTYGEDSDFFKVRVRGMFPNASARQFISSKLVDASYGKHLRDDQYNFAPVILTCDPAWSGDDELVIAMRQGLFFDVLDVIRDNDNDVFIAQKIASYEAEYQAAAVFIDAGYGTGIKSAGDVMGRSWQLVWFASSPINPGYLNKRAEMWGLTKEWLRQGGSIPEDTVLYEDLIGPETLPRLDGKIALESKEDMKKKGLQSPNRADALALSFAFPVTDRSIAPKGRGVGDAAVVSQYVHNPFDA